MSTGKFINILTQLRGPEISIEDIEWLDEFPVGKDVIEFLVSQVEENEVMLTDIALDREENEIWQKALHVDLVTSDPSVRTTKGSVDLEHATSYVNPVRLQLSIEQIGKNQALLERESQSLSRQIGRAQMNSREVKHIKKKGDTVHHQTSELVRVLGDEQSELSSKADTVISMTMRAACHYVDEKLSKDLLLDDSVILLNKLNMTYANLTPSLLQFLNQRRPDGPVNVTTFGHEVDRLCREIGTLEEKYIKSEYRDSSDRQKHTFNTNQKANWVFKMVEDVWNAEQAKEMQEQISILKQVSHILQSILLPVTTALSSSLVYADTEIRDILVLIQALLDELDDIEVDLDNPDHQSKASSTSTILNTNLQPRACEPEEVLSLAFFNDVKGECEDVRYKTLLTEFDGLSKNTIEVAQKWTSNARKLSAILFANAQTSTSKPWVLAPAIEEEVRKAGTHISRVTDVLRNVPNDFLKNSRAHRRLNAFLQVNHP